MNSDYPQNNILRDKNHIDIDSKGLDQNIGSGPYCVECAGTGSTLESKFRLFLREMINICQGEPCPRCKGTGGAGGRDVSGKIKGIGIGMGLMKVFGWPSLVVRRVMKGKKNKRKRREAERERQRQAQREDFDE